MVNLHLQGRSPGQTPRGVTLVRELAAHGIPVASSSDNCRDPFHMSGDLDAIEMFRETIKIYQLDLDAANWVPLVTHTPADIMGLPQTGRLAVGAPVCEVKYSTQLPIE